MICSDCNIFMTTEGLGWYCPRCGATVSEKGVDPKTLHPSEREGALKQLEDRIRKRQQERE